MSVSTAGRPEGEYDIKPVDPSRTLVEQLTPRERECLRLVRDHLTSKQIGRELQISHHTVEAHLDKARERLGVADRFEAARLLAAYEARARLPVELGADAAGASAAAADTVAAVRPYRAVSVQTAAVGAAPGLEPGVRDAGREFLASLQRWRRDVVGRPLRSMAVMLGFGVVAIIILGLTMSVLNAFTQFCAANELCNWVGQR